MNWLLGAPEPLNMCVAKKYKIYLHQMCSFMLQMHQNPFSAMAPPHTPLALPVPVVGWGGDTPSPCPSFFNAFGVSISSSITADHWIMVNNTGFYHLYVTMFCFAVD